MDNGTKKKKKKKGPAKKMSLPTYHGQNGTEPLGFFHQMSVLGLFCSGLLQMGQIFGPLPGSNIRKRGAIPRLFGGGTGNISDISENPSEKAILSVRESDTEQIIEAKVVVVVAPARSLAIGNLPKNQEPRPLRAHGPVDAA